MTFPTYNRYHPTLRPTLIGLQHWNNYTPQGFIISSARLNGRFRRARVLKGFPLMFYRFVPKRERMD